MSKKNMKSMDTDMSKLEKGEDAYLLSDDHVKPVGVIAKRKPFSWMRCLCWTVIALLGLLVLAISVVTTGAYFWTRHQVKRFTVVDDLPHPPLPVSPMEPMELEVLKDKGKLFWDQLRVGQTPSEDLVITEDELNGLIFGSDFLRGHASIKLTEDRFYADLALPADKLPGGRGRLFVGSALVFAPDKEDEGTHVVTEITPEHSVKGLDYATILSGKFLAYSSTDKEDFHHTPILNLEYGQFLNKIAPQDWIDRHENLIRCDCFDKHDDDFDQRDCKDVIATLGRLESIAVEDQKLIFTPRRGIKETKSDDEGGRRHLVEDGQGTPSIKGVLARRFLHSMLF